MSWSTTGHTAANVPVFATWPGAINGLAIDNTRVFSLSEEYLNVSTERKPPPVTGLTVILTPGSAAMVPQGR